jgi:triacylglycerol lipase
MTTTVQRLAACILAVCLPITGALFSAGDATAARPKPLPVPFSILSDAVGSTLAATSPPGANDWKCKPSTQHPEPVILVHGFMANAANNWQTFSPLLHNQGYCVFALHYGAIGPIGGLSRSPQNLLSTIPENIKEFGAFVDKVLHATAAKKVALIGHSKGATLPLGYLKFHGGNKKVSKMIGIAGGAHGTGGDLMPSWFEVAPAAPFIRALNNGPITQPGTAYTQILTRYDEAILPYTAGIINEPGAVNITIQDKCSNDFSDHVSIVSDPNVAHFVLKALDPAYNLPLRCTSVYPAFGVMPGTPIPPGISAPLPR